MTSLRTSRFIFGTASLFNAGLRKSRLALIEAAIDHGFTHFDTAPYYGFGWAERDLGEVLGSRPGLTVTTKVGIYSAGGENQSQAAVLARKALKPVFPALARPTVNFALRQAQHALAASLSRLRRDTIDAYLLHEPEVGMLQTEEWQRWLERERIEGRVNTFGLALTADRLEPFLSHAPGLAPLVQVLDSLERQEANVMAAHGRPLQITYGYVSAARAAGSTMPVEEVLRRGLNRNRHGAVIVSTTKRSRLPQYARLLKAAS